MEPLEDELRRAGDLGWMQLRMLLVVMFQWCTAAMQTYVSIFFFHHQICPVDDARCTRTTEIYKPKDLCNPETNIVDSRLVLNPDPGITSILVEWNLLRINGTQCDYSYFEKVVLWNNLAWFTGFFIGATLFGRLSDRFGRVRILYVIVLLSAMSTVMQALSMNTWFLCVARFVNGAVVGGGGMLVFILAAEISRKSYIVWISCCTNLSFEAGYAMIALLAYLVPHWRELCWINLSFHAVYLILLTPRYRMVDSPSRLLSRKRFMRVRNVLERIAKVNGRTDFVSTVSVASGRKSIESNSIPELKFDSWTELLFNKILLTRFLVLAAVWFFVSAAYYGIGANIDKVLHFGLNVYVTASLTAIMGIPGAVAAAVFCLYVGRKPVAFAGSLFAGVLLLVCSLTCVYDVSEKLSLTLYLASRLTVCIVNDMLFTYAFELMPASLRNQLCGLMSAIGHAGAIFSQLIILLDAKAIPHVKMPALFVMAFPLGIMCIFVLFFLPETRGKPLALMCSDLATHAKNHKDEATEQALGEA